MAIAIGNARLTRVPVASLFENLRDGATVDQFLGWFPGVSRADVASVLNHEVSLLTRSMDSAAQ